jgi:hypothetical protein
MFLVSANGQPLTAEQRQKEKVIIFKTISLKQTDSMTHFRQVPEDSSPPQAAEMLKKQDSSGDREVAASGAAPGRREN